MEIEKRNLRNTCREYWKRLIIRWIHRKDDSEAKLGFLIESVIIFGIAIAMVKYKKQKILNMIVDVEFSFRHLFVCLWDILIEILTKDLDRNFCGVEKRLVLKPQLFFNCCHSFGNQDHEHA